MAEGYRRVMPEIITDKLLPLYPAIDEMEAGKASKKLEPSLDVQQRKMNKFIDKRIEIVRN